MSAASSMDEPILDTLRHSTIPLTIVKRASEQRWIVGANGGGVERVYDATSE
jgi:hypothetical protein